jgi:hypothetical protein
MSESSDKPGRRKAGLSSGLDIVRTEPDADLSNKRTRKSSGPKSEAGRRGLRQNAYGPKLPAMLARIFGPPPLVGEEDPQLYRELFCLFAEEHDPKDTSDWLLVKDKTDLHWERLRERRLKAKVIEIYQEEPAEESKRPVYIITPEDAML